MQKTNDKMAGVPEMKLFNGEKLLVILSVFGFALAVFIAIYIGMYGPTALPEGNLERAFSFNAAIAIFIVSLAAILPLSGFSYRKRANIRWFFIPATLFAYAIETIQQFRGINPRFTKAGSTLDSILGLLFGVDSLAIIIVTVLLAIRYFRKSQLIERPYIVLGIRYALLSIMLAFADGLWMIAIQSRYTGLNGNLIVLHGLGFHALQVLPLLGWLMERSHAEEIRARRLIHVGGTAWMISMILIAAQTVLGHSVFQWTALPILAGAMQLICLGTVAFSVFRVLQWMRMSPIDASHRQ